MLEELGGASPKDFATCSKVDRRRGWAPAVFPRAAIGRFLEKARRTSVQFGVGEKRPAWVSGSRRPLQGRNCTHPNGLITPEQASALVEKGKTLRE
jgi:hypothetical protein